MHHPSSSLLSFLEQEESHHLVTHLRQNSKNHVRKILTIDPATMDSSRKARILQSFANKKIAAILRTDLERTYGEESALSVFNDTEYQYIVNHGLTVMKGRELYATLSSTHE